MFSGPTCEEVLEEIGDKVLRALVEATSQTRDDLAEYRRLRPDWAADQTPTGLANWINDRLWRNLGRSLDHIDKVQVVERGSKREIHIGGRYQVRVKRHDRHDRIRTYPTRQALRFWGNSEPLPMEAQGVVDADDSVRLGFGYVWDPDTHAIRDAVVSLQSGIGKNPQWAVRLEDEAPAAAGGITWQPIDPTLPQLDLYEGTYDEDQENRGDEQHG